MAKKSARERVIEAIAEMLQMEQAEINDEQSLVYDLDADSLDLIQLTIDLNEEFAEELGANELDKNQFPQGAKIKDIIELIEKTIQTK
ncbi:MAG: phosphopantetheine-binding protein [Patescibacteria group bacterium]|nr:phosphopantetheine-binding protein [Patescibacteria group bacterium]